MSKILKSIVGLAIITSSIGFAAAPAKAESKAAQCKRFDQTMNAYAQAIDTVQNSSRKGSDAVAEFDRWLQASAKGLKQLQSRQFSDPKIRSFQQSALNNYVAMHNSMADVANATARNDRAGAINALDQMAQAVQPEAQLKQQFVAYCGRAK